MFVSGNISIIQCVIILTGNLRAVYEKLLRTLDGPDAHQNFEIGSVDEFGFGN